MPPPSHPLPASMMSPDPPPLAERVEAVLGARPLRLVPLSGGSAAQAQVVRVEFAQGEHCVVKVAPPGAPLDTPGPYAGPLAEGANAPDLPAAEPHHPVNQPHDAPGDAPADAPVNAPTDAPADAPAAAPAGSPAAAPTRAPAAPAVAPTNPPLNAPPDALALEGWMLTELARRSELPVPGVIHAEPGLLVMDWIEADGTRSPGGEEEAAEQVAALHAIEGEHFGYAADTVLGGLHLPNLPTDDWVAFYAEHRVADMARRCVASGALPLELARRVEAVAGRLGEFLEPGPPSLVHGDLWGGNVLWHGGRVAAYIDPAVHHAHAEVELAFTTLFPTFGPAFHARYRALRPLAPGFDEVRRELYHLHPLLVHVRLFGGRYVDAVRRVVRRYRG